MNVKLMSPDPLHTADLMEKIAYMARVSNPSNQNNTETNERLLRYLIKHNHWSPFEMQSICLEIDTTRDIARQILRHRSFSFQEFSQRYAEPESMGYPFEMRESRMQDVKNRQNSLSSDDPQLQEQWLAQQKRVTDTAYIAYTWAISKGIAKEQARSVLPEGNTKSRMYMNGTVRSWMHYIDLRTTPGTQKEHMDVAEACAVAIKPVFPMIMEFVHGQNKDDSLSGSV
jgi:thymidylate synthase (FAD)